MEFTVLRFYRFTARLGQRRALDPRLTHRHHSQLGCPWIGQFEVRHLQGLAHCSALLCCPLCSLGCRAWGRGRLGLPWGSLMPICADYPLHLCLRSLTKFQTPTPDYGGCFLTSYLRWSYWMTVFLHVLAAGGVNQRNLNYLLAGCLKPFLGWSILFFFLADETLSNLCVWLALALTVSQSYSYGGCKWPPTRIE